MERIVYRITLDSHKTGIQRTLQGFETADNMARSIAVNITASGDTYEIPLDNVVAMMYVTTPSASEPSINECRIEDNTIYYDVLPIVEEGITEMQIKLIETSIDGAKRVLISPKFVVEVTESGTDDENAEQTTTFTALENAIAKAHGVYDQRLLSIEIGPDCVFRAIYADGTVYENNYFHEALYNGNALLSESWAKGGTGIREGEETNNSMFFSNVSRSSSVDASASADEVRELVDMAKLYSTYTSFETNFETGELEYISASHTFDINEETGDLEVEGELFDPSAVLEKVADDYLDEKTHEISDNTAEIAKVGKNLEDHTHTAEEVGAATKEEHVLLAWEVSRQKDAFTEHEKHGVNNNILINSNFANPVNQRGESTVTTEKYWIDRWRFWARNENSKCYFTNDGVKVENGTLYQRIEHPEYYKGKTLAWTFCMNGIVESFSGTIPTSGSGYVGSIYYNFDSEVPLLQIELIEAPQVYNWVKLEIGDHATPYVPRLYAEELDLCQRYYQKIRAQLSILRCFDSNELEFKYYLLKEMRTNPTIIFQDVVVDYNTKHQSGFELYASWSQTDLIHISAKKASHGLTMNAPINLNYGYIILDAEL